MVLPLFRTDGIENAEVGQRIPLTGAEGKHAVSVRRMRLGEAIQLSDGRGLRVIGSVAEISSNELVVAAEEVAREGEPKLKITVAQALAKGDRDELAIQAATELGCWAVIPWQAERSISRWDSNKAKKGVERWQSIVTEASKQSLRAWDPVVQEPATSKQLAALVASFNLVIVLEPSAEARLSSIDFASLVAETNGSAGVCLVVGPEGGISPEELRLFTEFGAKVVRLGDEVLRTSTAPVAAISAILALSGNW
jgi:16S rRNA (uracil1498-N3)-methyltransferase